MKLDDNFKPKKRKFRVDLIATNQNLLDNGNYTKEDLKEEARENRLFILNQGL